MGSEILKLKSTIMLVCICYFSNLMLLITLSASEKVKSLCLKCFGDPSSGRRNFV